MNWPSPIQHPTSGGGGGGGAGVPREPQAVGIAVVEWRDCFLIGVRGSEEPLSGCHEFPGGKCHVGETSGDCARRECREETGLDVSPIRLLLQRRFRYDHAEVDMSFWLCQPVNEALIQAEHRRFRWVPKCELPRLEFPAANQPVIELVMAKTV